MLAIIFRPNLFGQRGSYVFYYQVPRLQVKGMPEQVELETVELKQGLNFIDPEVWGSVVTHGLNNTVLSSMKNKGALLIYSPDADEVVGSTTDFTDLSAVSDIIRYCSDKEWISRSISRDPRKQVFALGSERIKEIEEDRKTRQQGAMALEVV